MTQTTRSNVISLHEGPTDEAGGVASDPSKPLPLSSAPVKAVPPAGPRPRGRPRLGQAVARDLSRDEEILRIAVGVVWRKGFAGTKLSDIAEAAGIVKGSLYHYFDSKEEIYERLVRNVRGLFEMDAAQESSGTGLERMEVFLREQLAVILAHPMEIALLTRDLVRMRGPTGDWAREGPKKQYALLRKLLLQGQKEGSVRVTDPDMAASMILGVLAHVPNWYRPAEQTDTPALIDEIVDFILTGLAGPSSQHRQPRRRATDV